MPTFIELCSGAGGLSQGFISSGFVPLLLNDVNKDCCQTLKLNHPNVSVVQESMEKIKLEEYIGKVDCLIAGLPCQSFSVAGKKKGLDDSRGNLFVIFSEILIKLRPKIFVIENVKGLKFHNKGTTFQTILKLLSSSEEYKIKYEVLNSFNFEVPQKRERMFIIGVRKDISSEYVFPEEQKEKKVLRDVLLNCPESKGASYSEKKKKIFSLIPEGGCWVDLPLDLQKEYMGKSFYSSGGKRGMAKRLAMDKPSLTLTTSPVQKMTERIHPTAIPPRPLTVREYARIQTFPDNYVFSGSMSSQYKQIGNAVPVKLAEHVARSVLKLL